MLKNQKIRPWLSLLGAFFIMFGAVGLGANGISLLYLPVTEALGFSQTAFSLYYTIAMLVGAVLAPITGKLLTKFMSKLRIILGIGSILLLISFWMYSISSTLMGFYLASAIRGLAQTCLSGVAATMVVNNWFVEKRAVATSIAFIGTSVGGVVFTKLCAFFLNNYGWRTAYLALGLVCFVINVIMVIITEPLPANLGLVPYGYRQNPEIKGQNISENGVPFGTALRTPSFWILFISLFVIGICVQGTMQGAASALQLDHGHSLTTASNIVSIFMVGMCVGKFLVGIIFDKKGLLAGIIVSTACEVIGYAAILFAGNIVLAVVFGVAFGLGNVMSTMTANTATIAIFGTKDYGVIYGFACMAISAGCSIGPTVTSRIFDSTGSYNGAWVLYLAAVIICNAAIVLARILMKKRMSSVSV